MQLEQGDILATESGKRKVLGVVGEVIFVSDGSSFDRADGPYTEKELLDLGWKVEEKEWEPKLNEYYWYINALGFVCRGKWEDIDIDKDRVVFLGGFPTEEAAQKRLAEIKELLKK